MSAPRRWVVRVSQFPFAMPGRRLGVVEATTKADATTLAALQFPAPFVVEPEPTASCDALARELRRLEQRQARQRSRGRYSSHSHRPLRGQEDPS